MGGEQAASVLATVERDGIEAKGGEWSAEEEEAFKAPIRDQYEHQGSPYYSTARLWDDGIIDPLDTRRVLGMGLAAAANAPVPAALLRHLQDVMTSSQADRRRRSTPCSIANRGEIARADHPLRRARVGLRTVAVLLRRRPPGRARPRGRRRLPDRPDAGSESYLDIEAILAAARDTRRRGDPPRLRLPLRARRVRARGRGRRARLRRSVRRRDGPDGPQGPRPRDRRRGRGAGGAAYHRCDGRDAVELEFPVLVKAAAGGGGKGMRVVRERRATSTRRSPPPAARRSGLRRRHPADRAVRRARPPRRGAGARRRARPRGPPLRARLLRPAPAPEGDRGGARPRRITEAARAVLTESAVALAREVGYVNAGTVEFLVDHARGTDGVYFLEMNTRLQVEHPVTELVVSSRRRAVDLVELPARGRRGRAAAVRPGRPRLHGHAIEARVYAEDAFDGFLPQAGTADVRALVRRAPATTRPSSQRPGRRHVLRPDARQGDRARPDPGGRPPALVAALDDTAVIGLTTNTGFLRELAASDEFRDCDDRHRPGSTATPTASRAPTTTWPRCSRPGSSPSDAARRPQPVRDGDGWRSAGRPAPVAGRARRPLVGLRRRGHRSRRGTHTVAPLDRDGTCVRARGRRRRVEAVVVGRGARRRGRPPRPHASLRPSRRVRPRRGRRPADGTLTAPMPGTVLAVDVAEGDAVEEGQRLGVLEAMKMELALRAPFAGTVTTVGAATGGPGGPRAGAVRGGGAATAVEQ